MAFLMSTKFVLGLRTQLSLCHWDCLPWIIRHWLPLCFETVRKPSWYQDNCVTYLWISPRHHTIRMAKYLCLCGLFLISKNAIHHIPISAIWSHLVCISMFITFWGCLLSIFSNLNCSFLSHSHKWLYMFCKSN